MTLIAPTTRLSPVHDALIATDGSRQPINGMPVLVRRSQDEAIAAHLGLADRSCLTRFGVKGAGAAQWLASQNLPVPDRPNTWCPLPHDGLIARLGMNEFLIEDGWRSRIAPQLAESLRQPVAQVYPVLRQDAAIVLTGAAVNELLLQTCSVNFRALNLADRPVMLTSMIGIAVTILPAARSGLPFYRVWCDGTFGLYLWRTLLEIIQALGGDVVGTVEPPATA